MKKGSHWRFPVGFVVFWAMLALGPFSAFGADAGDVPVLRVDDLIARALDTNPDVRESEENRRAVGERISQAGSLPDPMFAVGLQNDGWDRFSLGDRPMSNLSFTLSQKFPFPGKRGLRAERAAKMEAVAGEKIRGTRTRTAARVRMAYADLVRDGESISLLGGLLRQIERIEEVAEARYGSGVAGLQDVLMAQTQKYRVLEKIEAVHDTRRRTAATLAEVTGMDAETILSSRTETVSYRLPAATLADASSTILSASPAIAARERAVETAKTSLALARRNRYPDITVAGMYAARNSSNIRDLWRVGISTTIPIFARDKQEAAVREARAELAAAEARLESARRSVEAEARSEWSRLMKAQELMALYERGLREKSRQGLESALAAYRNGKADMTMVIRNLVDAMNADLGYWKQYAMRQHAAARLAALAGDVVFAPTTSGTAVNNLVTGSRTGTPVSGPSALGERTHE